MTDLETNQIIQGDSRNVLADLPDESVHAIVTDPPYGLAFMGRSWDDFEPREYQDWCKQWAKRALEVLKPGGHLLAFSGNRTHHRLFTGVEDAGFTVRDCITWHHGNGFPKGLDVAKAADDEADEWAGWNTHMKPATEFVVLARKPFDGTVAENVQEHGTSALNIDGCRVDTVSESEAWEGDNGYSECDGNALEGSTTGELNTQNSGLSTEGRYPANVIFDEIAAQQLDDEVGELKTGGGVRNSNNRDKYGEYDECEEARSYPSNSGGPSRYFYTSKATKAERTLDGKIENAHPTVKPQDLMEWLVKLVTKEGQIVLDPFCGSGTTCKAAKELGREFIGIEKQKQWADVSRVRCGLSPNDPGNVRSDDGQRGLEAFGAADD